jgi:hypothetical protein
LPRPYTRLGESEGRPRTNFENYTPLLVAVLVAVTVTTGL